MNSETSSPDLPTRDQAAAEELLDEFRDDLVAAARAWNRERFSHVDVPDLLPGEEQLAKALDRFDTVESLVQVAFGE